MLVARHPVNGGVGRQRQGMLHQAWFYMNDGCECWSFLPIVNRSALAQLPPTAQLLWSIEAASWTEANSRYHEWRGLKPYVPMDDDDPGTYTPEQEHESRLLGSSVKGEGPTQP